MNYRDYSYIFNKLLKKFKNKNIEIFAYLVIKNNKVSEYGLLSIGDYDSAPVSYSLIGKILGSNPEKMVFIHNHPSGNPQPSKEDLAVHNSLKYKLQQNFAVGVESYIYCNDMLYNIEVAAVIELETADCYNKKISIINSRDVFLAFAENIRYNAIIAIDKKMCLTDIIKIKDIKKSIKEFMKKTKSKKYFLISNKSIYSEITNLLILFDYEILDYKNLADF